MKKKVHVNEKGVGHVVVVVVIVVLVAIGLVAWLVASNKKSPSTNGSTSSTSSSAAYSSCMRSYSDSRLCNFAANSADFSKTAYTATLNITQSGTTSTATLKSDGKGNTDLTTTSNGESINAISLNGNTYLQENGSGTWIEYPSGTSAPTSSPTSNMNIAVGSSGITYRYLGTSSCGSLTCYEYKIDDSSMADTTQYAWIDTASYKLREWKATDSSGNTTTMTITYTPVTISTPSPVESFSQAE